MMALKRLWLLPRRTAAITAGSTRVAAAKPRPYTLLFAGDRAAVPAGGETAACPGDWAGRVEDHAMLCDDPAFKDLLTRAGATLIDWRALRDLQRA